MRTFIEIAMPDEAMDYIRHRQDQVCHALTEKEAANCFRWTQISGVHLTLRFLGDTNDLQQQQLSQGLAEVAEEWPPLSLGVSRLGGFPSVQKPRVLWLGIDGDLDGLHRMQAAVERLVQACGFEAEVRPYSPHLTIARTKRDCSRTSVRQAGTILSRLAAADPLHIGAGRFSAATLVHMRSDLQSSGAIYTPLSTHKFAV